MWDFHNRNQAMLEAEDDSLLLNEGWSLCEKGCVSCDE